MSDNENNNSNSKEFRRESDRFLINCAESMMKEFPEVKSDVKLILQHQETMMKKQAQHDKILFGDLENLGEGGMINQVNRMKTIWTFITAGVSALISGVAVAIDYWLWHKKG